MSMPRLPFLWPFLFRPSRCQNIGRSVRHLRTGRTRQQELATQRYGNANEPPPHLSEGQNAAHQKISINKASKKSQKDVTNKQKAETNESDIAMPVVNEASLPKDSLANEASKLPAKASDDAKSRPAQPIENAQRMKSPVVDSATGSAIESMVPDQPNTVLDLPSPAAIASNANTVSAPINPQPNAKPTDSVASIPVTLKSVASGEHKAPHINTPRYVHHFDTYSLVKKLEEGGWTQDQAITVMKAVRLILADNLELAQDGLVSQSNVENETYLFRAACSELRTEVGLRRTAEVDKTRTERTALQHEVDILGQRVGMEAVGLKEDLKGMVEGRKMEIRDEGRRVEGKIQELNYRITVSLNSDSRSDVEGLRLIITKRAITALVICILMVVGSLKYASSLVQHEEEAKKKRAAADVTAAASVSALALQGPIVDSLSGGVTPNDLRDATGVGDIYVQQDANPSFVSLG